MTLDVVVNDSVSLFQIQTIELNKGWNSRLGFSVGVAPETQQLLISAIYDDSVAAKDGRLQVGDHVLRVNFFCCRRRRRRRRCCCFCCRRSRRKQFQRSRSTRC